MKILFVMLTQKLFGLLGLRIQRIEKGVNVDSALEEQLRLAGNKIKCIVEVGAADGRDCVIYAERCPEATIYAFEPLPENFKKLKEKALEEPRIIPINAAASSKTGTAPFYVSALEDASSLLPPKKTNTEIDKYISTRSVIDVTLKTIDQECSAQGIDNIDILKMDAQGAELEILQSATKLLKRKAINVIYSEVNFIELYDGACLYHELMTFLKEYVYALHSFYDLKHNKDGRLAWGDAIFLPNNKVT